MTSLAASAIFFVALHLGVSGSRLRDHLVRLIGVRAYMVAFSLGSVAGMAWLVSAYNSAGYAPLWTMPEWWKAVAILLMLPACLLVVVGLTTPNPTSVAQESLVEQAPRGIVRITRHPFLIGVALWSAVHVVSNGDIASLLLFSSLLVVAAAGTVSIDAKRRRSLGSQAWDAFAGRTSIIPLAAVAQGRNSLALHEMGWWRPAAGVTVYVVLLFGHAHIIGVSPWPQ